MLLWINVLQESVMQRPNKYVDDHRGQALENSEYVHGYTERESQRLSDQAQTLVALLHSDTRYPTGSSVLEAGCGIGAQTVTLARNSPGARITSVDISEESIAKARTLAGQMGVENVRFQVANIFELPFREESFDHIFICFVLEHLRSPEEALLRLKRMLKPGGTITIIEGDHGSCYWHPESGEASSAWQCLIRVQRYIRGNSLIGRQLYPLLAGAGFTGVAVSPRMVYVDASRPDLVEGFIRRTIIPMVEGVRDQAVSLGMIDAGTWEKGIAGLHRTAEPDGTFCYTFFKGTAVRGDL